MATKFLRKIILEELQKVLKEDGPTSNTNDWFRQNVADDEDSYTKGPSGMTKRSLLPGEKDFMGPVERSPLPGEKDFMGPSLPKPIKKKSNDTLRREAILKLQKELARIGAPVGLRDPKNRGVLDITMMEYLKTVFPRMGDVDPKKLSINTINVLTKVLSRKNPGTFDEMAIASGRLDPPTKSASAGQAGMSVNPPAPPVATGNLGIKKKEEEPDLSFLPKSETPEEKAERYKRQEEERRKAQEIQQKTSDIKESQQESITREINKLLKKL